MKVSSPSSYGNIFSVYGGSGTLTGYTMPPHRGLFVLFTGKNRVNNILK
jgi:hypothetical protein